MVTERHEVHDLDEATERFRHFLGKYILYSSTTGETIDLLVDEFEDAYSQITVANVEDEDPPLYGDFVFACLVLQLGLYMSIEDDKDVARIWNALFRAVCPDDNSFLQEVARTLKSAVLSFRHASIRSELDEVELFEVWP